MQNRWIALTGGASSGKDSFFRLLSQRIECRRYSLADKLKEEVREVAVKLYGIDPLNCSLEEKGIIRPLYVSHGLIRRTMTNGRYWWEFLDKKIYDEIEERKGSIPVITDVRYDVYGENDELGWIKRNKGILVHIRKFIVDDAGCQKFDNYVNDQERDNDPRLSMAADWHITWPNYKAIGKDESILYPYVNEFVFKLQEGFFNK